MFEPVLSWTLSCVKYHKRKPESNAILRPLQYLCQLNLAPTTGLEENLDRRENSNVFRQQCVKHIMEWSRSDFDDVARRHMFDCTQWDHAKECMRGDKTETPCPGGYTFHRTKPTR